MQDVSQLKCYDFICCTTTTGELVITLVTYVINYLNKSAINILFSKYDEIF